MRYLWLLHDKRGDAPGNDVLSRRGDAATITNNTSSRAGQFVSQQYSRSAPTDPPLIACPPERSAACTRRCAHRKETQRKKQSSIFSLKQSARDEIITATTCALSGFDCAGVIHAPDIDFKCSATRSLNESMLRSSFRDGKRFKVIIRQTCLH